MGRSDVGDEVRWSLFARLPLPLPCLYCLLSCECGEAKCVSLSEDLLRSILPAPLAK
jgi:hypothetical protein